MAQDIQNTGTGLVETEAQDTLQDTWLICYLIMALPWIRVPLPSVPSNRTSRGWSIWARPLSIIQYGDIYCYCPGGWVVGLERPVLKPTWDTDSLVFLRSRISKELLSAIQVEMHEILDWYMGGLWQNNCAMEYITGMIYGDIFQGSCVDFLYRCHVFEK